MDRRDSGFAPFLFGFLAGVVVGLLYAPRSGRETREILKKSIDEYATQGKQIYEEKAAEITEVIETGKKTAEEKIEIIKQKAEEAKRAVSEKISEITKKKPDDVEPLPEE
jgi:gas vesicle protein